MSYLRPLEEEIVGAFEPEKGFKNIGKVLKFWCDKNQIFNCQLSPVSAEYT